MAEEKKTKGDAVATEELKDLLDRYTDDIRNGK